MDTDNNEITASVRATGSGINPIKFKSLLYGINTLIGVFPEGYGKISTFDRNSISRSIVKYLPTMSQEQLDEIEYIIDNFITEYKRTHSISPSTFYKRPTVIQKRYNEANYKDQEWWEYEPNDYDPEFFLGRGLENVYRYRWEEKHDNPSTDKCPLYGSCPDHNLPEIPLQPDPWDPEYQYTFESNIEEMLDFFIKSQDQIATMPETYIPDFKSKVVSNFGPIDENQFSRVEKTMDAILQKYRGIRSATVKKNGDVLSIPPEKYVASLYEKSLDKLENYFIYNNVIVQAKSLMSIKDLRKKLVNEDTAGFCYLQLRTYESAFDTILYRTRPTKITADKALINFIRFIENNNDRYMGITRDGVDFIANSLKMVIPSKVTKKQRAELRLVIDNLLVPYYSTAIEIVPVELRDPQLLNKFRSRVFSRDEALENIYNTHIQDIYRMATKRLDDIKNANSMKSITQIRAEILNNASKENNDEYTRTVFRAFLDSFIASARPASYTADSMAFGVHDYFSDNGKSYASLNNKDAIKVHNNLQEKLPIDGTDKEQENLRQYIDYEASKAKSLYNLT